MRTTIVLLALTTDADSSEEELFTALEDALIEHFRFPDLGEDGMGLIDLVSAASFETLPEELSDDVEPKFAVKVVMDALKKATMSLLDGAFVDSVDKQRPNRVSFKVQIRGAAHGLEGEGFDDRMSSILYDPETGVVQAEVWI